MGCDKLAQHLQVEGMTARVTTLKGMHMKKYLATAAFVAVTFAAAGSASALDCNCELFPPINNNQSFIHAKIDNVVNAKIGTAVGDVKVTGTAVGNNLSIDAGTGTTGTINNKQVFAGYGNMISSTVNVSGTTTTNGVLNGKLTVANTAVANNASIKLGGCTTTCSNAPVINNNQSVAYDPTATTNVSLASVSGLADISTTSIGNNLSVEGRVAAFNNVQSMSWAPINSITNVSIGAAGAGVNINGTAIGNNASWNLTPKVP